jgi:mannose-6-phosphate isomerase-like protein (cupin superfamily)
MTYPPSRYHETEGEASAWLHRHDAPHDLEFPNGGTASFLATGDRTDGLFGLYRWNMAAQAGGAAPHFHRTMAESFYVLRGRVTVYDGRSWIECEEGDFLHVPPGGVHGFRNESEEPASMLIHFAPGGPREAYFEGLARWARDGRPGADEADAFFREHDNLFISEPERAGKGGVIGR